MKVHHVGYLVKKLDKAAEEFEKLGFVRQGDMTNDTYRKVDILFPVSYTHLDVYKRQAGGIPASERGDFLIWKKK